MEKHVTLVGILNIVYRSLMLLGALVLFVIGLGFNRFLDFLVRAESADIHEVPTELLNLIPVILLVIGFIIAIVSILGIIGGIGLLKKKEWARIVLLVVSFFNLLHIPLGTILGAYSIWVLMNEETIRLFAPVPSIPAA